MIFKLLGLMFIFNLTAQAEYTEEFRVKKSLEHFDQAVKVFQHPRCLNCHPNGERPTQGMDMHVHIMNVKRGKKDHGAVAMQCSACHQAQNNSDSGVPGAPKWALAPKSMAWQGLSKSELCESLKDRSKTHMTMEEFLEHNGHDKLVAWGWNPGPGRDPVPFTQEKFLKILQAWADTGAECPVEILK